MDLKDLLRTCRIFGETGSSCLLWGHRVSMSASFRRRFLSILFAPQNYCLLASTAGTQDVPAKQDERSSLQIGSPSQQTAKVAVGAGYQQPQPQHRRRHHASSHKLILVVAEELLLLYVVSNRLCYMHCMYY